MRLCALAIVMCFCSLEGCPGCVLKEGTLPNRVTIVYNPPIMCLPDGALVCPTKEGL